MDVNSQKVYPKHVEADYSDEHFKAVSTLFTEESRTARPLPDETYEEDEEDGPLYDYVPIGSLSGTEADFKAWCVKEEETLGMLEDKRVLKVINRINRKVRANRLFNKMNFPFQLSLKKDEALYSEFLKEFLLMMHNYDSFDDIVYDVYRGTRSEVFQIDLEVYKKEYAKIMWKNKNWFQRWTERWTEKFMSKKAKAV